MSISTPGVRDDAPEDWTQLLSPRSERHVEALRTWQLPRTQDAALRMSEHYPTLGMQVFRVEKPWAELDGRDAALTHFVVPGR